MADSDLDDPTRVPGHTFAVEMREAWARIPRSTPEERAEQAARYEAQLERDRAEMAAELASIDAPAARSA